MADFDFDQFKKEFMDGVNSAADAVSTAAKDASGGFSRYVHFKEIGADLFLSGAITSHGGNLSECDGNTIWITRTDSMLHHIGNSDIQRVYMSPTDLDQQASTELVVHRAMYQAWADKAIQMQQSFGMRAIVHAHPKFTVFRSLIEDKITPIDCVGQMVLGESVPVFDATAAIGSEEVAALMAEHVTSGASIGIIRGHGPFSIAETLQDAYRLVSCLEHSAELLTLFEMTGRAKK